MEQDRIPGHQRKQRNRRFKQELMNSLCSNEISSQQTGTT